MADTMAVQTGAGRLQCTGKTPHNNGIPLGSVEEGEGKGEGEETEHGELCVRLGSHELSINKDFNAIEQPTTPSEARPGGLPLGYRFATI